MPLPYGMDDAQLRSIIHATHAAVADMKSVNSTVQAQAQEYIRANNSDSGRLMQQGLYRWTGEFNQIVGDLEQLNFKVDRVRQQNAAAAHAAVSEAKGAHL